MAEQRRHIRRFRRIRPGVDIQLEAARAHLPDFPREPEDAIERGLDPGPAREGYGSGRRTEVDAQDAAVRDPAKCVRKAPAQDALIDAGGEGVQGDDALAGRGRVGLHDAPDD